MASQMSCKRTRESKKSQEKCGHQEHYKEPREPHTTMGEQHRLQELSRMPREPPSSKPRELPSSELREQSSSEPREQLSSKHKPLEQEQIIIM
eukprot:13826681-Ditylum_brightwellii.AAC.1